MLVKPNLRFMRGSVKSTPPDEAALIRASSIFDAVWYLERNPDATSFPDAITHYLTSGARDNRPPHPLFDLEWYRATNPDLDTTALTPLGHFAMLGEPAGKSPSPLFDPAWYARSLKSPKPKHLFRHFLEQGARQNLSPHPAFDPAFYRAACPDAANPDTNPLTHFIGAGAGQGISPNPFFDLRWYVGRYPEVAKSGLNPLVHFLHHGAARGLRPHPAIDLAAYRATHPGCPADPMETYIHLLTHENPNTFFATTTGHDWHAWHQRLVDTGLFDPATYLAVNPDLTGITADPHEHFARVGLHEGRPFTDATVVARVLAGLPPPALPETEPGLDWFHQKDPHIGVFCSAEGNFYMQEIADLLALGLRDLGIRATRRDETADRAEIFDLRVFVAPHEFFQLGSGLAWQDVAGAPTSVLYNVEQMQTQWFCRAFKTLLMAPLLLDINVQSAAIMRQLGCRSVPFMPGYLPSSTFAQPIEDVSNMPIAKGYPFARQRYNWQTKDALEDRPIDVLFIGASSPRRDKVLESLLDLADDYRFLCIYKKPDAPLTTTNQRASSGRINCALAQRSKVVVNVYRDWLGYFDWSRIVQQGVWQGACVVSDPGLPHPVYRPGEHFQQESTRHMAELIRWLLGTADGRQRLDTTRRAGFAQARTNGSMQAALAPVLTAFKQLLTS
jgi:hypothetical protein